MTQAEELTQAEVGTGHSDRMIEKIGQGFASLFFLMIPVSFFGLVFIFVYMGFLTVATESPEDALRSDFGEYGITFNKVSNFNRNIDITTSCGILVAGEYTNSIGSDTNVIVSDTEYTPLEFISFQNNLCD